jgi:hypothetical protein
MSLSGAGRRRKGVKGEREVREIFEAWDYDVRGLEGEGDHLATRQDERSFVAFHLEVKRQEKPPIHAAVRQAHAEAPDGFIPLVCYRRSGEPWRVVLDLGELLRLVDR